MKTYRLAAFAAVLYVIAVGPGAPPAFAASPGDPAYVANVGCPPSVTANCQTVDSNGNAHVINAPATATTGAISPVVSTSLEASHVIKAASAAFYDGYVTTGATGGNLLILDAASDPGNGAVTPKHCIAAPANTSVGWATDGSPPERYSLGVVMVFSTGNCVTETQSATAFFHGRAN